MTPSLLRDKLDRDTVDNKDFFYNFDPFLSSKTEKFPAEILRVFPALQAGVVLESKHENFQVIESLLVHTPKVVYANVVNYIELSESRIIT